MKASGVNYFIGKGSPTLAEAISKLQGEESKKKLNTKGEENFTPTSAAHLVKRGEPQSNQSSNTAPPS